MATRSKTPRLHTSIEREFIEGGISTGIVFSLAIMAVFGVIGALRYFMFGTFLLGVFLGTAYFVDRFVEAA